MGVADEAGDAEGVLFADGAFAACGAFAAGFASGRAFAVRCVFVTGGDSKRARDALFRAWATVAGGRFFRTGALRAPAVPLPLVMATAKHCIVGVQSACG